MEETMHGTKDKINKESYYEFQEFPKNIRQIGVPMPGKRIYIEDYVVTYLKQSFAEMQDSRIVVLLGTRGKEEAAGGFFIYGGIALPIDNTLEHSDFSKAMWDKLHQQIHESFSGAQILGWACGISLWNSEIDRKVRKIHKEQFSSGDSILFLQDMSEKEEKLFLWEYGILKEMPGYYIFFEKNAQMQDFMLIGNEPESIDADYKDVVTTNVRQVISNKEEVKRRKLQLLGYGITGVAVLAILLGINMLMQSTAKINSMEKTVDALSQYVSEQKEDQDVGAAPRQTERAKEQQEEEKGSQEASGGRQDSQNSQDGQNNQDSQNSQDGQDNKEGGKEEGRQDLQSSAKPDEKGKDKPVQTGIPATVGMKGQSGMQSYIVKRGDTLSQILWKQYHTMDYENEVKELNQIKNSDKIYEGQRLLLPNYIK